MSWKPFPRSSAQPKGPRKGTRSPHRYRPLLEILEDRCLLAGDSPGVPDVEGQFLALKHHGEALGWHLPTEEQGAPDPSIPDHYQGVARFPGTGTPVLYVTQKDNNDNDSQGGTTGGYLEVVRFGSRDTDGERLRSNLQVNAQSIFADTGNTPPPAEDTWASTIRFNGIGVQIDGQTLRPYVHPGGMAIVDNILFVGMDTPDGPGFGGTGMIVLFDLGEHGEWRETPRPIQALSLDHSIDNLAVTKISNEQYLIWVNGDGGHVTRFYKTNGADLRADTLQFLLDPPEEVQAWVQDWDPSSPNDFVDPNAVGWRTGSGAHQSSTFIREWNGSTPPAEAPLYLIGMRHEGPFGLPLIGDDRAELFRVGDNGLGGYRLTHVRSLHMFGNFDGSGRIANFATGNNAYVSPSGELILYSIQHDDQNLAVDSYVKMAEFRHRDVNRPDSPLRLPAAVAGGAYSVEEGGAVTLNGSGAPRADRPWIELYDDNGGWLHGIEHPNGDDGDRSIVVDYDDRSLLELNNFNYLDGFNDKTTSVRWRMPVGLDVELFEHDNFGGDRRIILRGTGQTESISHLGSFSDAASSMRFVGSAPESSPLLFAWDLDADGSFGETGAGAAHGDETGAQPAFSAAGLDGPGAFTVSLRVTDSAGLMSGVSTAAIDIANVAPTIATLTSSNLDFAHKSADGVVTIGGSFTDPAGPLDTHTVTVSWGDGTPAEMLPAAAVNQASYTFSHSRLYASGGIFTITVTIADEDGGVSASQTTTAVVTGVGLVDGVLYVIGTDEKDHVKVKDKDARLEVEAKLDKEKPIKPSFPASAVDRIVIILGGGDDHAEIDNKVTIDALILGGDGKDHLHGGGGHNVLVGGAGDDHLYGGDRADILIGGSGKDHLGGRKGNDILIGGFTDHDEDLAALDAALAAWKTEDLPGVLNALLAFHDDEEKDDLQGDQGDDELFGGLGDKLKD